jgi:TrmH family RNA methyltransferase
MISKNQIKQIQTLHLKKNRDDNKLFLVEGIKLIKELLEQKPGIVKELFATCSFIENNSGLIKKNNVSFTEISEAELKKISTQTSPNNALAICDFFEGRSEEFNFDSHFSLYLDDIRDPGNFGTIIRLADWYGISSIFCSKNSCDLYNPKVIQSTMGAFLRVMVKYLSLSETIDTYNIKNVYGAVLNGNNIYKEKLSNGIIVIGNEANGINSENLELINRSITIPSQHTRGTESLNAAMATSIITSEFFRQTKIVQ